MVSLAPNKSIVFRPLPALSKWIVPASLTTQAAGLSVRPEKTVVRLLIAGNLFTLSQVFIATNGSVSER